MNRLSRGALLVAGTLALGACDILDVDNPNNLTEGSVLDASAATAVVNGALHSTAEAIGGALQPYTVAGDELTWIGSRDAWKSLDEGFISDPNNEFTDAEFPALGEARWMAWRAVNILEGHLADGADVDEFDLARAYFIAGLIYTFIGEVQQDFALSDKTEAGMPIGPANMTSMFDDAIGFLDQGITLARSLGETELELRMLALRARAKHSKAVRQKIQPTPNTADPLVSAGVDDAKAVIAMRGNEDWSWAVEFSSVSNDNDMASWVNDRAENQFGAQYVSVDPKQINEITGYVLADPVSGAKDPRVEAIIKAFIAGDVYSALPWVSVREAYLIVAEDALNRGDMAAFAENINTLRALTGMSAWSAASGVSALEMLKHERRVNLFLQGRRLSDMYRWGESQTGAQPETGVLEAWSSSSDAAASPGTLLPVTIVELQSNPNFSG